VESPEIGTRLTEIMLECTRNPVPNIADLSLNFWYNLQDTLLSEGDI